MLHRHHLVAMHQSMGGVAHPVSSVQVLLHKVKQAQAGVDSPLEHEHITNLVMSLRDDVSPDGPAP